MIRILFGLAMCSMALSTTAMASEPDHAGECPLEAPVATRVVSGWTTSSNAAYATREATVKFEATITPEGRAESLSFLQDPALEPATIRAARSAVGQWNFKPATRCGQAVAQRVALIVPVHLYPETSASLQGSRPATSFPVNPTPVMDRRH